jgi:rubrerythrin
MSAANNIVDDILRTAIQREIDAYNLYHNALAVTNDAVAKDVLTDLANQEKGHRSRLETLADGNVFKIMSRIQVKKVQDLKITDYLVEVPLTDASDLQDVLIVAGKRERASFELYAAMARIAPDDGTRKLFEFLASEELGHKIRVERLYDDLIYQEN